MKNKRFLEKSNIFICILILAELSFWCAAILSKGKGIQNILFCQNQQTFLDFFECICSGRYPYESSGSYPPLAYMVFKFFGKLIPPEIRTQGMFLCRQTQSGLFAMMCFFVVSLLCIVLMINQYYRVENLRKNILIFAILSSLPMLFCYERMNIVFLIVPLIFYFLENYQSDIKWKKHVAYICLAIAAGIKMYPALLGILVIKEKNIKDIFCLLAYGIVFFFCPFLAFGGLEGLEGFWANFTNSLNVLGNNLGYGYKVNISNTVGWIFHSTLSDSMIDKIGTICSMVVVVLAIICLIWGRYKENWKNMCILLFLMILLPDFSFIYSLILLIPVIISFLNEKSGKLDNVYALLFGILFSPFFVSEASFFNDLSSYYLLNLSTMVESIVILIIYFLIIAEGIRNLFMAIVRKDKAIELE